QPRKSAASFIPTEPTLMVLRQAASTCTGCDLYKRATQTVFGEGAAHAKILLVGEQPGDQEDRAGHSFVGPAGSMLERALAEAGISRKDLSVTNAVKHFKWESQGKRRKHKKPSAIEIAACRPWIEAEVRVLEPHVIVCLGVTAAQSVFGKGVRLHEMRGRISETVLSPHVLVTVHPSAILRHPDKDQRDLEYRRFVNDLNRIADIVQDQAA